MNYLQISNNSVLAEQVANDQNPADLKSKQEKILEIRNKFGLNINKDLHGGEKPAKDFIEKKASLLDTLI